MSAFPGLTRSLLGPPGPLSSRERSAAATAKESSQAGLRKVNSLRERLEVRKLLDRAKGLLQSEHGMTEPQAFRWIQKTSMDRRLTMRKVAEAVIEGTMHADAADKLAKDTVAE